jgi:hypothetical protein
VQVSTPVFTYYPAVVGNPAPARVQAVIAPPVPPVPPVKQFGKAVWVKEIKTTTHNNKEVKLRDLVSDDPVDPNDKNWANGEPDEVEVEWRILQKRNIPGGGANDELAAAPEDLPNGDEVVTRRYEFYKYTGPLDEESGEASGSRLLRTWRRRWSLETSPAHKWPQWMSMRQWALSTTLVRAGSTRLSRHARSSLKA